jgi:hypothetical protein
MSATTERLTEIDMLSAMVDEVIADLDGQALVSQSRCVNDLLDLWNTTTSRSARRIVAESLNEISNLSAVEAQFMRECSDLICLAAGVDEAFDHLELHS